MTKVINITGFSQQSSVLLWPTCCSMLNNELAEIAGRVEPNLLVILIRTQNMAFLRFFFDLQHLVVIVSFYLQMFFVISRIISCRCFTHSFVHYRFEIQQSLNPAPRQSIKSSVKQEEGFSPSLQKLSSIQRPLIQNNKIQEYRRKSVSSEQCY